MLSYLLFVLCAMLPCFLTFPAPLERSTDPYTTFLRLAARYPPETEVEPAPSYDYYQELPNERFRMPPVVPRYMPLEYREPAPYYYYSPVQYPTYERYPAEDGNFGYEVDDFDNGQDRWEERPWEETPVDRIVEALAEEEEQEQEEQNAVHQLKELQMVKKTSPGNRLVYRKGPLVAAHASPTLSPPTAPPSVPMTSSPSYSKGEEEQLIELRNLPPRHVSSYDKLRTLLSKQHKPSSPSIDEVPSPSKSKRSSFVANEDMLTQQLHTLKKSAN